MLPFVGAFAKSKAISRSSPTSFGPSFPNLRLSRSASGDGKETTRKVASILRLQSLCSSPLASNSKLTGYHVSTFPTQARSVPPCFHPQVADDIIDPPLLKVLVLTLIFMGMVI
nr:PREDICTED: uncharacterized protein LOC108953099 [Musa acuminata subsp. malaccensis]